MTALEDESTRFFWLDWQSFFSGPYGQLARSRGLGLVEMVALDFWIRPFLSLKATHWCVQVVSGWLKFRHSP